MSIINNMFEIMEEKGIKPSDLCCALHISSSTVANWKSRGTDPPAKYIVPICEFLEITPYRLLTGEEDSRTIGIQNSTVTNSSNVEVTGIRHETISKASELSETTAELVRVFELLPVKARIRLMNMVYDFEEKYQNRIKK